MVDNSLFPLIQMEISRKVIRKRVVCWADKNFSTEQYKPRSINIYLSCLYRKFINEQRSRRLSAQSPHHSSAC